MLAAISSLRDRGAGKVVIAAPAGSGKTTWQLHETADKVVIPHAPSRFKGVAHFYEDFSDVTDRDVEQILKKWFRDRPGQLPAVKTINMPVISEQERSVHCELDLPPGTTRGSGPYPAVIFAHGMESDGRNRGNVLISRRLAKRGVVGVRLDFTGHGRSDGTIHDATADRMLADLFTVFENLCILDEIDNARIGIRGSGTGSLIALHFAAREPQIAAMVIRGPWTGGEPEIAQHVNAPTLLIHAENDQGMTELNKQLAATHEVLVIPESGRVYNDPISVELMVNATVDWLVDHLVVPAPTVPAAPTAESAEAEEASESAEAPGPQETPAAPVPPDADPADIPVVEAKPPDPSQAPAS
jgi:dienelactone hydrolase